jgi:SOS response regulatory protein OraA/RecX
MNAARARSYVMWLLARRHYSRYQLEKKLKEKDVEAPVVSEVLQTLVDEGFFREDAYAKARTSQLLRRGLAPTLVKYRLKAEKCTVTSGDIDEALDRMGSSLQEELKKSVEKALRRLSHRNYPVQELERKVIQSLMRQGHRANEIKSCLREIEA